MTSSSDRESIASRTVLRLRRSCSALGQPARHWWKNGTRRGAPKLNYDVLHYVAQYLEFRDVLRVMHTCRTLYDLAMPMILRDVTYTYVTRRDKLYRALLDAKPARFMCVASLTCLWLDDPEAAFGTNLLMDFFRLAFNLETLSIEFPSGVPLTDELANHIGSLPNLKHLAVRGRISFTRVLQTVQKPLKSLRLDERSSYFGAPPPFPAAAWSPHLQLPAVAPWYSSLEAVHFHFASGNHPLLPAALLPAGCCFPAARNVRWTSWATITAAGFARIFPHVTDLDIRFVGLGLFQHSTLEELRVQNAGLRHWDASHEIGRLHTDPATLWVLALRCKVEHLNLFLRDENTSRALPPGILPALLADIRPTSVKACFGSFSRILRNGDLQSFVYDKLKHLHFSITMEPSHASIVQAVLSLIPFFERRSSQRKTAKRWSVRFLSITFEMIPGSYQKSFWMPQYRWIDWQAFARLIFAMFASVRIVVFKVTDFADLVCRRRSQLTPPEGDAPEFAAGAPLDGIARSILVDQSIVTTPFATRIP